MALPCAICSTSFEPKKSTQRYCSPTCRKRAQRAGVAESRTSVATAPRPAAVQVPAEAGAEGGDDGTIYAATLQVLRDAGRDRTPRGRVALKAAQIIDGSWAVQGMAALLKDYDRALDAALAGAQVETDAVDEVEAKRQEKLRRLGVA